MLSEILTKNINETNSYIIIQRKVRCWRSILRKNTRKILSIICISERINAEHSARLTKSDNICRYGSV